MKRRLALCFLVVLCVSTKIVAAEPTWSDLGSSRGDQMLEAYFQAETTELTDDCLSEVHTLDDWQARKRTYRSQLFEMLGLDPLPKRTELAATVTGKVDHPEFTVEKLHFQSRPGLYVTANLYVPKQRPEKLPAILYVCGHGRVKRDGISYGNKASYQHHGGWFARNGYVCLMIDTLQLGEIEGIHHGTYREKMWWWNCRGYTSAGVEAWNCIRALDYLQSRPEVDPDRLGVTGRSGGGAYSWWIAALDDRIKVAVPVAGITSLKNHVVDGCVEGHCDCMFMVNTYRWDFPLLAALVAPRPLLISNTDKDRIFPLDGVVDVHGKVRRIYQLHDQLDHLGLQICEGPHKDTQELRIHAFHWFNRFLKKEDPLIEMAATKLFAPEDLKVFDELPTDQCNTRIQETFTQVADPPVPDTPDQWATQKQVWMARLRDRVFRGWPAADPAEHPLAMPQQQFSTDCEGIRLSGYDFVSEKPGIKLRLYVAQAVDVDPHDLQSLELQVLNQQDWEEFIAMVQPMFGPSAFPETSPASEPSDRHREQFEQLARSLKESRRAVAYFAPRGVGLTAWNSNERKATQIRRRFMLLGQTRDGMQVWDTARAIKALRERDHFGNLPLTLQAEQTMAGIALYASLFTPQVAQLDLHQLPASHQTGPIFLNVLRWLDVPQAVALAAEQSRVVISQQDSAGWEYPRQVMQQLSWPEDRLQIVSLP